MTDIYEGYNVHRFMGNRLLARGQTDLAIKMFDSGLDHYAPDVELSVPLYTARSRAFRKAIEMESARQDAVTAKTLNKDANNMEVIENDAATEFGLTNFEEGLLTYHKGLCRRTKPDYFTVGVNVAEETIEDCIGRNAGDFMNMSELGKTIVTMEKEKMGLLPIPKDLTCEQKARKAREIQLRDRVHKERYLGRHLADDHDFLVSCKTNPNVYSNNPNTNAFLKTMVNTAVTKFDRNLNIMMIRQPWYAMKHRTAHLSERLLGMQAEERRRVKQMCAARLRQHLDNLTVLKEEGNISAVVTLAARTRRFIMQQPDFLIPNKAEFLSEIHHSMADFYLQMKTLNPDWSEEDNIERILFMMGVIVARELMQDAIRKTCHPYNPNYKNIIAEAKKELLLSHDHLERAYLCHELAKCYSEMRRVNKLKAYAKKCLDEAEAVQNYPWMVNAMFLQARQQVMDQTTEDAKKTIIRTIECAKNLDQPENVIKFLINAHLLIDDTASMDVKGLMWCAKREREIVNMMCTLELRAKMSTLIAHMNGQPLSRHMGVMRVPGLKETAVKSNQEDKHSHAAKTKKKK